MLAEEVPVRVDHAAVAAWMAFDLVVIAVFSIGIYFRRYQRKDLAVVFAFFNIGLFVAVTVIQVAEAAVALGFGLFAILSIIRLRSEPFSNREIGYFFGALVLGLLNGIEMPNAAVKIGLNAVILGAIYVLDHPRVLVSAERRSVILDLVETRPDALRALLEERLGAEVTEVSVDAIDFVKGSMRLEVRCRRPADDRSGSAQR